MPYAYLKYFKFWKNYFCFEKIGTQIGRLFFSFLINSLNDTMRSTNTREISVKLAPLGSK